MAGLSIRATSFLLSLGLVALAGLAFAADAIVRDVAVTVALSGIRGSPINDIAADAADRDTQSTTAIVDLGGGNLIAAFNDSGSAVGGVSHLTGFGYSSDYGLSWIDGGTLPDSAEGDFGSPALAYDGVAGVAYLATRSSTRQSIQVFPSTDKGHSWGQPANGGARRSGKADRPSIAADNFAGPGRGDLYLCWTRLADGSTAGGVMLTRSVDGGETFRPANGASISNGGDGCSVVVSPNHQVNVFYYRGTGPGGQGGDNKLYLRRSFDRGVTFAPEVVVADLATATANGDLRLNGGLASNSFPRAAVNNKSGRAFLYVVFNDDPAPADPRDNSDIYLTTSADGGRTWSKAVRVNDDTSGDQYFPAIALTSGGERLIVSYYSRSQDPANRMFHRRARLATLGGNGAPALNPSFQLGPNTPPAATEDPGAGPAAGGDRDQIASDDSAFSLAWSDNRRRNAFGHYQADVQFARISAEPTTTDLRVFASQSAAIVKQGQDVRFIVKASATGGIASDVFLNVTLGAGLQFQSAGAGDECDGIEGFIGCSLGSIAPGTTRTIQIVATATAARPREAVPIGVTTSSRDTNTRNDFVSPIVEVFGDPEPNGIPPEAGAGSSVGASAVGAAAGAFAASSTLSAAADTYVDETQKTVALGSSTWMTAKTATGFTRHSYVKFDTESIIGAVASAKLRLSLRQNGTSYPAPGSFTVWQFLNNSWSEASTWNTRPSDASLGAQLASKSLPITRAQVMEIDVTSYVNVRRASGSPVVSFSVRSAVANNSGVIIDTRETAAPPQLVLVAQAPPSCTLSASPASIDQGESASLSWNAEGAVSGEIDNGVGAISPIASGSTMVAPPVTTTYTATVTGSDGQQGICTATVEVIPPPPPPPPTCTLLASPDSIDQGESVILSWSTTDAVSGSVDNGVGEMIPIETGSVTTSPPATTTYTATVTGPDGQGSACSKTVEVIPPPPPPSCALTASPATIAPGESALLRWSTFGAVSGGIDNGIGEMSPIVSGSSTIAPPGSTTYIATVTAADGQQGSCSADIDVGYRNTSPDPVLIGQTPLNPVPLSPPPIAGIDGPYEMIVSGNYAYVTNERLGSFAVLDISDPARPSFVAESPRPGINGRGLSISGPYAYVADMVDDSISIFDITDPKIPLFLSKLKSSTLLNGARSIVVAGDYAYVGNTDADSLAIVDVSNTLQPAIVATLQGPVPGSSLDRVTDVAVSGGYAYVASSGAGGLNIIDVSAPTNPTWVSAVACPGGASAAVHGVKVVGGYAYVACAGNASFGVIDVSDPANPLVAGWTNGPEPGSTFYAAFHLAVLGNYAYVTLSDFSGVEGKVVVVDISDPANPTFAGQTSQVREARAVYAAGRYLYTASDAWDAVMVFDVGAPAEAPPPTCVLQAPASIDQGEATGLSWSTERAVFGSIDYELGTMDPIASGSREIAPDLTTAYTATVIDDEGQRGGCLAAVEVIPAPGNGVSLAPIADAYVSQASPKTSYGSVSPLVTKTASSTIRHAYMKYDTSSFTGQVISAKLRLSLQANGNRFPDPGQFSAFEFLGNGWTESATWNTRPPDSSLGKFLASKTLPIIEAEIMEIDVTNFVNARRAAGIPVVSFSVRSYGAGGVHIDSRESANPPELVLIRE